MNRLTSAPARGESGNFAGVLGSGILPVYLSKAGNRNVKPRPFGGLPVNLGLR